MNYLSSLGFPTVKPEGAHQSSQLCGHGCSVVGSVLVSGRSQVRIPLQLPRRDLGKILHSQLTVALRLVNSDTVSML